MINTDISFYGQQSGERILYVIRPHLVAYAVRLLEVIAVALVVIVSTTAAAQFLNLPSLQRGLTFWGNAAAILVALIGSWIATTSQRKNVGYVTDRRVVKFELTTPFATSIRSLSWEEAVKVKTVPPNVLWKQLRIGTLVVHAKTTISSTDVTKSENIVTDDDVEIHNVYYYRDLGNYIEKILFLYKKHPKEIADLQPFVPRPRGQRG